MLLVQPVIRVANLIGTLKRCVQPLVQVRDPERVLAFEARGAKSEAPDRKLRTASSSPHTSQCRCCLGQSHTKDEYGDYAGPTHEVSPG